MKFFLIFILFTSLSFSSVVWKVPTLGPIEAPHVFFEGKFLIGSYDGFIYLVDPINGQIVEKIKIGDEINWIGAIEGKIVAASQKSIYFVSRKGNITKRINNFTIFSVAISERVYVLTNEGLQVFDKDGNLILKIKQNGSFGSEIRIVGDQLIYSLENYIYIVKKNGTLQNIFQIAPLWKSKPLYYNNFLYLASIDGYVYAFNLFTQEIKWRTRTDGWIMSSPLYFDNLIFVGSNDKHVYALNPVDGKVVWKIKTGEAVQGELAIGEIGGKNYLFAPSNDGKVYMIDYKSGEVVFVFSSNGWARNPFVKDGILYFSSYDNYFYAFKPDRSCKIEKPQSGEKVGYYNFEVKGKVFTRYGNANVFLRINNGSWIPVERVEGNAWRHKLNPNNYDFGVIKIECKVADSNGEERENFEYVVIYRSKDSERCTINIEIVGDVAAFKPFKLIVSDQNKNKPLEEFKVKINKNTYSGKNGSLEITLNEPFKEYEIVVWNDECGEKKIKVSTTIDLMWIIIGFIILIFIIGVVFYFLIYKRK